MATRWWPLDDEPGDSFAASVGFVGVDWWAAVEASGEVDVPEAADGVLAGRDGSEQVEVGRVEWVEAGVSAPAGGCGPAQGVEGGDAFAL